MRTVLLSLKVPIMRAADDVVVVVLFYVHSKHLRSCQDGHTLFQGRLRPPKQLNSTSCTFASN